MDDLIKRLEDATTVVNGGLYPLPWQVARRSYDSEQVIASGNVVITSGLAVAGNVELRKAIVEIVNAAPEIIATLKANATVSASE